jgi:hypothetical protein
VNLSDSKVLQHSILALLNHDCDNSPIAWFGYSLSVAAAVAASMNRIGFWKESSGTLILRTKEVLSILLPLIASAVSFHWFQRLHIEVLSIHLEHHAQQSKGGDEDIAKADLEHRDMSKTRIPQERNVDACVVREGRKMTISWEDLVPGDVVHVQVTFPFHLLPSPRCTTPTLSPSSCSQQKKKAKHQSSLHLGAAQSFVFDADAADKSEQPMTALRGGGRRVHG